MSLKKGILYQLTPFGRFAIKEETEARYRERLLPKELNDLTLLRKRQPKSLSDGEFQRLLDYMTKAGVVEEVPV
jgi:hypothetical protein